MEHGFQLGEAVWTSFKYGPSLVLWQLAGSVVSSYFGGLRIESGHFQFLLRFIILLHYISLV